MRANTLIKAFITLLTASGLFLSCVFFGCSPVHVHTPERVEAQASTCDGYGVIEHWRCAECGETFAEESMQTLLDDVTLSPVNHSYASQYCYDEEYHFKVCSECGHKNENSAQKHTLTYRADGEYHYEYCFCGFEGEPEKHIIEEEGMPCGICRFGGLLYELSADESYYVCAGVSEAYKASVTEIDVPDEYMGLPVKELGERAFQECKELERVTLGKNLVTLGAYSFMECNKLKEVNLNAGLIEIGASAFSDCAALEEISFPASLAELGARAFYKCESLKKAEFGAGVTVIPAQIFYGCSALEEIVLDEKVTEIETAAFSGTAITALTVPAGVKEIPMTMCLDCRYLESVTIPASVKSVGGGAFSGCTSLSGIIFLGTQAEWSGIELSTYPQAWNYNTGDYSVLFAG